MMLKDVKPGQIFTLKRTGERYTRLADKKDMAKVHVLCLRFGEERRTVTINYNSFVTLINGKGE